MQRYLSTGVSTIVALMAAHRSGSGGADGRAGYCPDMVDRIAGCCPWDAPARLPLAGGMDGFDAGLVTSSIDSLLDADARRDFRGRRNGFPAWDRKREA